MRKFIVILFLLTSARTLISCCKDLGFNFRWSKAIVININVAADPHAPLLPDSIKIANFGFRLSLEHEQLADNVIHDFGVNNSYALSCDARYLNKDSVTLIDVSTLNNFDSLHPAGSSVAGLLLTRPGTVRFDPGTVQYKPIIEGIQHLNSLASPYNNILDFKFRNMSAIKGQHTFIISVSFASGRIISGSTSVKLY